MSSELAEILAETARRIFDRPAASIGTAALRKAAEAGLLRPFSEMLHEDFGWRDVEGVLRTAGRTGMNAEIGDCIAADFLVARSKFGVEEPVALGWGPLTLKNGMVAGKLTDVASEQQ